MFDAQVAGVDLGHDGREFFSIVAHVHADSAHLSGGVVPRGRGRRDEHAARSHQADQADQARHVLLGRPDEVEHDVDRFRDRVGQ